MKAFMAALFVSAAAVGGPAMAAPSTAGRLSETAPTLKKVRFGSDMGITRMVLELDGAATAKVSGQDGVTPVLQFAAFSAGALPQGRGQGLIAAWSADRNSQLTLVLVRGARIKRRFLLPPADGFNTYRYVIDVVSDDPRAALRVPVSMQVLARPIPSPAPPPERNVPPPATPPPERTPSPGARRPNAAAAPPPAKLPPPPKGTAKAAPPPKPATPPVVPAAAAAGSGGRRNINPYDRDIELTVPLTFNKKPLGEVPVLLTRDDRYLIRTGPFLRLMRDVLTKQGNERLAAVLAGRESFEAVAIESAGVIVDYDETGLTLVIVKIDPSLRAVQALFDGSKPDPAEQAPQSFSAYLNGAMALSRQQSGDMEKPSVFLDGAVRFHNLVFEANVQGSENLGQDYSIDRRYARFVYDEPTKYRRWYLGDLDPEIRGRQGTPQLGGFGVSRQRQRFDPYRAGVIQGNRSILLQTESTVRVMRNGSLLREFRLQPGQYDLSNLPLQIGSNDVQIEIRDDAGRVQSVAYRSYLDPIELDPGDYEYGAYIGQTALPTFGSPDYSQGELGFTGFYRKAFVDRPAIGLGLQGSKSVQMANAQTQFVLPNAARLQLDGAVSNAKSLGGGYVAGAAYDWIIDRGAKVDTALLQVDYTSRNFSSLGNIGTNSTSWTYTGTYSRAFTDRVFGSAFASYRMGRDDLGDSYRVGVSGNYRLNRQWSAQFGADYTQFPASNLGGAGVNFTLVWQPSYDRRAELRHESVTRSTTASYVKSAENRVGSYGYSALVGQDDGASTVVGSANYIANRFDAALSHTAYGRDFSSVGDQQVTTLSMGSSIAYAGGKVAVGRRISDSFAILYPHKTLDGRAVIVGDSLEGGRYMSKSGAFGPAMAGYLSSYVNQPVRYDVLNVPPGYDIGSGSRRVNPGYRSGYKFEVGTGAFVSALGNVVDQTGRPLALVSGRLRPADDPKAEPQLFFTNSIGRFAMQGLTPGKTYQVELFTEPQTRFSFTVPADNGGLLDLNTVKVPITVPVR